MSVRLIRRPSACPGPCEKQRKVRKGNSLIGSAIELIDLSIIQLRQPTDQQGGLPGLGFWAGYELECLYGRHRAQAAKQALIPQDIWWTIDLYRSGKIDYRFPSRFLTGSSYTSAEFKAALTEEYPNECQPSDGEIYRKLREFHFQNQYSLETR